MNLHRSDLVKKSLEQVLLLNATLGPGLLKNIYDGIERPLQKIEEIEGAFISEGSQVDAIDTKVKWDVTMLIKEGDVVTAGEISRLVRNKKCH